MYLVSFKLDVLVYPVNVPYKDKEDLDRPAYIRQGVNNVQIVPCNLRFKNTSPKIDLQYRIAIHIDPVQSLCLRSLCVKLFGIDNDLISRNPVVDFFVTIEQPQTQFPILTRYLYIVKLR